MDINETRSRTNSSAPLNYFTCTKALAIIDYRCTVESKTLLIFLLITVISSTHIDVDEEDLG